MCVGVDCGVVVGVTVVMIVFGVDVVVRVVGVGVVVFFVFVVVYVGVGVGDIVIVDDVVVGFVIICFATDVDVVIDGVRQHPQW